MNPDILARLRKFNNPFHATVKDDPLDSSINGVSSAQGNCISIDGVYSALGNSITPKQKNYMATVSYI